jgi:hypothetical protein
LPCLDTFSELFVYSSGHISPESLKQFDNNFAPMLKDPKTNDLFRLPFYMAAGEADIALTKGPTGAATCIKRPRSCFRIAGATNSAMPRLCPLGIYDRLAVI